MAGLGDAMKPAQQAGAPMDQQAPMDGDELAEGNAAPEEQATYERIMGNALKVIYPEGEEATVSPAVLEMLKASDKPLVNVSNAAVSIVTNLRASAAQAGIVEQWDAQATEADMLTFDEILFHAGKAIVEELCEVAEAAKIHEFNEQEIETAFFMALDMYRETATQSGTLDAEALKGQWGEIVEADKAGRLGEVLPGIEQRMQPADEAQAEDV